MNLQENQINLKFSEDHIIKCKEENTDDVPKLVKIEKREDEYQEYVPNIVKIKQEKIEIKDETEEINNKQESVYTNLEDSASFLAESTNNFEVKIEIKEQEEVTDFTSSCIKNEELDIKCENEEKINIANKQDSNCLLKKFKCNICGKSFAERNRKRHLQVHTDEDTNCTICKKTFSTIGTLKEHLLIHNGKKNYYCSICRKSFYTRSRLNRHSLIHTNDKVLECSICKMPFCAESHLQRHLMTHTGEKNHKCNFCTKSFTRKSDLKVHFTIHTGEKNHKCSICERSFSRKSGLKEHLLVHGLTLAYTNKKTLSSSKYTSTIQSNMCEPQNQSLSGGGMAIIFICPAS